MQYSNFTRRQAGVLYRAQKEGKLDVGAGFMSSIYSLADMYILADAVQGDVESYLRAAVDAVFQGDYATAQDRVDSARTVYQAHFRDTTEVA